MTLYRLTRRKYSYELSGIGAALKGARWNSKGTQIIYTAENRALALAELLVHLTPAMLPIDYMILKISIPEKSKVQEIVHSELHENWNRIPYHYSTQKVGDAFIQENKHLLLRLPSAVVPGEYNLAINPFHKDFDKVKIISRDPFPLDDRLF